MRLHVAMSLFGCRPMQCEDFRDDAMLHSSYLSKMEFIYQVYSVLITGLIFWYNGSIRAFYQSSEDIQRRYQIHRFISTIGSAFEKNTGQRSEVGLYAVANRNAFRLLSEIQTLRAFRCYVERVTCWRIQDIIIVNLQSVAAAESAQTEHRTLTDKW
jgi:hypothetical protein